MNHTQLERNITLYGFLKIFTKRVFLPLTAIYFVEVGHLSIAQIGVMAVVSAVVSIVAEIPTGYFADRVGRRAALMTGSGIALFGPLTYILYPNLLGAILGTALEALGYSFVNGAGEALMHDTLRALKRSNEYAKIAGRAQSIGLISNVVLISAATFTYKLDKRLPFAFGALAFLALGVVAYAMVEPPRTRRSEILINPLRDLVANLRFIVTRHSFLVFGVIGVLSGLYTSSSDFTNLIIKDLGLAPNLLGFLFGAASLCAATAGFGLHHLKRLSFRSYMLLDVVVDTVFYIAIGLSRNLVITIVAFLVNMAFWRFRNIMYQHYFLLQFENYSHKATLISTINFFSRINEAWLPFMFVGLIHRYSYYQAYHLTGVVGLVLLIPFVLIACYQLQKALPRKVMV
jgi:MFS family permease